MKNYVITIARENGSNGRAIGEALAGRLGIPFYNRDILRMAADDSGINEQLFANAEKSFRSSLLFRVAKDAYNGEVIPPDSDNFVSNENLFRYQAKVMLGLAQNESCVMIGRCADFILRDRPNVLRVFIHAPEEVRVRRVMQRHNLSEAEARRHMRQVDKRRADYYRAFTGSDWRDAGLRYTSHIDLLPFGQLTPGERANIDQLQPTLAPMAGMVQKLHQQGDHRWLLIDLPDGYSPLTRSLIDVCDRTLVIVHPDGNSHIRLHQQALPVNSDILINDLRVGSQLQEDLYQLWLESQRRILPVTIHRDEAMAECLAAKQPLGEYRQDSLAAEEILTLANWCLLHYAGKGAE